MTRFQSTASTSELSRPADPFFRPRLQAVVNPNSLCADFRPHGPEITSRRGDAEDLRSLSLFISYGRFRTVIMGDLTWNKEFDLMCPNNKLGSVDVYFVSHHGSDTSGSEVLVHALRVTRGDPEQRPAEGWSDFRLFRY